MNEADLNNHHRDTIAKIFSHSSSGNVEFGPTGEPAIHDQRSRDYGDGQWREPTSALAVDRSGPARALPLCP